MTTRTLTAGACRYWTDGAAYSQVTLPDGRTIPARPQPTAAYRATARDLGYPDPAAMSREHDYLHAALAAIFGATSPALLAAAAGADRDLWREEELVKLVAARLNDPAADHQPGGGLVVWLRAQLREGSSPP